PHVHNEPRLARRRGSPSNKRINLTVSCVTPVANSSNRRATRPAGYARPSPVVRNGSLAATLAERSAPVPFLGTFIYNEFKFAPSGGKRTNRGEAVDRSMGQLSFTEIGQSAVGEDGEYYFTAAAIEPRDRKRLGLPLREDTSSEDLRWWQRLDFFL